MRRTLKHETASRQPLGGFGPPSGSVSARLRSWIRPHQSVNDVNGSRGLDSTFHNNDFQRSSASMLNSWMDDTTPVPGVGGLAEESDHKGAAEDHSGWLPNDLFNISLLAIKCTVFVFVFISLVLSFLLCWFLRPDVLGVLDINIMLPKGTIFMWESPPVNFILKINDGLQSNQKMLLAVAVSPVCCAASDSDWELRVKRSEVLKHRSFE